MPQVSVTNRETHVDRDSGRPTFGSARGGGAVAPAGRFGRRVSALGVVAALLLSGCSPDAPGRAREAGMGVELQVPALWADAKTGNGGIEPAVIWVDANRTAESLSYEVNLADVAAKGGGAQWLAATSSAAAVATLFSGLDPNDVAYRFDITGPIDGPSAGGILTVGILAALNGDALDPKVTMTGTISPDGSIGPVGLVAPKLQAAAAEGYSTVVLPAAITQVTDPESNDVVPTEEFAADLDVRVAFVRTLDEAYQEFTGVDLTPSEGAETPFEFADFPRLDAARTEATLAVQEAVADRLVAHSDAPPEIAAQLERSRASGAGGNSASAFGQAVDALDQFERWLGAREFALRADGEGDDAAAAALARYDSEHTAVFDARLAEVLADASQLSPSQALSLPGALGWIVYGRAILASIAQTYAGQDDADTADDAGHAEPGEDHTTNREALLAAAGLAFQVVGEVDVVFPATLDVLRSVPSSPGDPTRPVDVFLSGYTNFLVTAGDGNLTYLQDVGGMQTDDAARFRVTELLPVATELAAAAADIEPGAQSLPTELEQSALAMTYFVATSALVGSLQVFGNLDVWLTPDDATIGTEEAFTGAIEQSVEVVRGHAAELRTQGLNAGFPLWSAEWGYATHEALAEQGRSSAGASIALQELWYDVVTVLTMSAFARDVAAA